MPTTGLPLARDVHQPPPAAEEKRAEQQHAAEAQAFGDCAPCRSLEAEQVLVLLAFLVPAVRRILDLLLPDRVGQILEGARQ